MGYQRPLNLPREPLSWLGQASAILCGVCVGGFLALLFMGLVVRWYIRSSAIEAYDAGKAKVQEVQKRYDDAQRDLDEHRKKTTPKK